MLHDNNKLYPVECRDIYNWGVAYYHYLNNKNKDGVRFIDLNILICKYCKNYNGIFGVKFISKKTPNAVIINNIHLGKKLK